MKRVFISLLIVFLFIAANGQRPFIQNNGTFRYFTGSSEPPSDWKSADFIDSGWTYADTAIIGFGWPKQRYHNVLLDSLVIDKSGSLYIRSTFNVDDASIFKDLSMVIDYDDAFVAYLNGTEIARVNLGKKGEFIAYNRLSDRSHEAHTYRIYNYAVDGFYIDSTLVRKLLKNGKNVLAFQVHNDSINGSDLTFNSNIYNLAGYSSLFNIYSPCFRYIRQTTLDSSKFPIVFINTDEYDQPGSYKVKAHLEIIDKKNQLNYTAGPIDFSSQIGIERRGESSSAFPKMSFNIETQNADGSNMDTSIMGMPSDNDWVLYSSYADKSLIRTEFIFSLGRKLDHYEPRTQYCELVYNGEYQGLYIFMEKIKRGKKRVNVAKRDSINPAEGGFVFKFDKPNPGVIQQVYPKKDEITANERDYLQDFWSGFVNVLSSRDFLDPVKGYKNYISTKSVVDFVIINELTKNCDAYLFSTYFYKDKASDDTRIKYGPLWDYDLAFGGASWQRGNLTNGWQYEINTALRIKELFRDPALTKALSAKWWKLREGFLSTDSLMFQIDSITSLIEGPRLMNYTVWPILDKFLFGPDHYSSSYDDDVQQMKDWMLKRITWIDDNIDKIYYAPLDVPTLQFSSTIIETYPNPFTDRINIRLLGETGNYTLNIQSLDGKILCSKTIYAYNDQIVETSFNNSDLINMSNGIFFVVIQKDGQIVQAKKIIKN